MAIDIYSPTSADGLSLEELDLYHLLMDYRAENGLDPIPLSTSLTTTAGRHTMDTLYNIWEPGLTLPPGSNLHSWSDAPYYSDHSDPDVMWSAPERIGTPYTSNGYEISAAGYSTIEAALAGWQSSPGHNDVILNQGIWEPYTYEAIGIGVEHDSSISTYQGNIYHVWFGMATDPAGAPDLVGTDAADNFLGTTFADNMFGLLGNDTIDGNDGDDVIAGGAGADLIDGGLGNDTLIDDIGSDTYIGGGGTDAVQFAEVLAEYVLSYAGGILTIGAGPDTDTVDASVETLSFGGTSYTYDAVVAMAVAPPAVDVASDFDGDGTSDILWLNPVTFEVGQFAMSGGNPSWTPIGVGSAAWDLAGIGDFDGDGDDDLLWHNASTGAVGQFEMEAGANVGWSGIGGANSDWSVAATGDFDGDGDDDILWHNAVTGEIGQFEMQGGQNVGWSTIGGASLAWVVVDTGDFDGDGDDDILWMNQSTGAIGQFEMQGGQNVGWSQIGVGGADWVVEGTGDFDGDGDDDILWYNTTNHQIGTFQMQGGSNTAWMSHGSGSAGWEIVGTGDYDGSGHDDILWFNATTDELASFTFSGSGPVWDPIGTGGGDWAVADDADNDLPVAEPPDPGGPDGGWTGANTYVAGPDDPNAFNIELVFNNSWTTAQQDGVIAMAELLCDVITGDLPSYNGIDDVRVQVYLEAIDGGGGTVGQGGWIQLRADGQAAEGGLRIDVADADSMIGSGIYDNVVLHEMLHAIGFGTTWTYQGLRTTIDGEYRFTGENAIDVYNALYADIAANDPNSLLGVPVESDGGSGAAGKHWDEGTFGSELMTTTTSGSETITDLTLAALEDMGFETVWDPLSLA